MTEVNVGLLRKVLDWAELEAQADASTCSWDQTMWYVISEDVLRDYKRAGKMKFISYDELVEMDAFSMLTPWEGELDRRLEWIKNSFENGVYVLSTWTIGSCKSTGCIAGYTSMTAGDYPVLKRGEDTGPRGGIDRDAVGAYVMTPEMKLMNVNVRAAELLGLDETMPGLFGASTSIEMVRHYAEQIAGGPL